MTSSDNGDWKGHPHWQTRGPVPLISKTGRKKVNMESALSQSTPRSDPDQGRGSGMRWGIQGISGIVLEFWAGKTILKGGRMKLLFGFLLIFQTGPCVFQADPGLTA